MKKILLLGASGSIGQNTIEVLKENLNHYHLIGFSVNKNINAINNILEFFPTVKYIGLNEYNLELINKYPHIIFIYGDNFIEKLIEISDYDLLVNSLVGFSGVLPTIQSINKGKNIALANKESLVVAGEMIIKLAHEKNVSIIPIDSEHSAIMQCLKSENHENIKNIILTCSGGALRDYNDSELTNVTIENVLNHPTWNMGQKITVDSATLVNKAFEMIEAHYLFNVSAEQIKVILHRQSIIHSMVEYIDGSIIAELGSNDMKYPIRLALSYPERLPYSSTFDLTKIGKLEFENIKSSRLKVINYGYKVINEKGTYGAAFNAANDLLVNYFLNKKIHYLDIINILSKIMDKHNNILSPTIEQIIECDKITREKVINLIKGGF